MAATKGMAAGAGRTKNLPRGGKAFRFVIAGADGSFGWELLSPVGRPVASAGGFASSEAAEEAAMKFRAEVGAARIVAAA